MIAEREKEIYLKELETYLKKIKIKPGSDITEKTIVFFVKITQRNCEFLIHFIDDNIFIKCEFSPINKISSIKAKKLYEKILEKSAECKYSTFGINKDKKICLKASILAKALSDKIFWNAICELAECAKFFLTKFKTAFYEPEVILFPGRFQPFHKYHLETFKNILLGKKDIFRKVKEKYLLKGDEKLIIAIGPFDDYRNEKNPLTVGERTDLLKFAIKHDSILMQNEERIEWCLAPGTEPKLIVPFMDSFDLRPKAVLTANPTTYQRFKDYQQKAGLIIRQWDKGSTYIRKLIAEGKYREVKKHVPTSLLNYMKEKKYLEKIKNYSTTK